MKQRVEEMEREANKLRELQAAAEKAEQGSQGGEQVPMETEEDKAAADGRSIYVGNVRTKHNMGFWFLLNMVYRLTIPRHRRRSSNTSRRAGPSTASLSFVTSSQDTLRGTFFASLCLP